MNKPVVYCDHLKCSFCEPIPAGKEKTFRKQHFISYGNDCKGKCTNKHLSIEYVEKDTSLAHYKLPICRINEIGVEPEKFCTSDDKCLWERDGGCDRDEIYMEKNVVFDEIICRCHSDKQFKGHFDNSRFPGTASSRIYENRFAV